MKLKRFKPAPTLITVGVIFLVWVVCVLHVGFFQRLERITYDMRVREAVRYFPQTVATNLGFVDINDASIAAVQDGSLGYRYGLYWPRQVYGRLVEELSAEKAKAVALDVIFAELRPDHPPVQMANGTLMESDNFFAMQMRRAGNVIIAATKDITPPPLFTTNALALGDITTDRDSTKDSDGVLRRAMAFRIYRRWHWLFRRVAADPGYGIDLSRARIEPGAILLPRSNGEVIRVPIDAHTNFEVSDFLGNKLPPGMPRKARAFTDVRVWHMGIVLAARELGLDLKHADVDLKHGKIVLHGPHGIERTIPVNPDGSFYINWCLTPNDPRLTREPIQDLLMQNKLRLEGKTNGLSDLWKGKLAVVGSSATGNDLTDRGATPLQPDTLLASEHWNVANSVLTGHFVRRASQTTDWLLIALLAVAAALLTWQLRALWAFALVVMLAAAYVGVCVFTYAEYLYWLPLVLPVLGALLTTHVCLVTWRVVFEQAEQRRVRSIFSRIVSPNIVSELLQAETLALGGARREVTVLFADVRGFTAFTDANQERAAAYVAEQKLTGNAVETYFDEQARETLNTVNAYLALVADMVKKHDGTLDKYIGDCVMAFWGAPTPNTQHALACVRAAIDAQRAVYELNRQRTEENQRRELENTGRVASGLMPKPLLPILLLGTGINTGMATVGLMGSEAHISNYTVFGREVNLASRLESLSGRGRILISDATYQALRTDAPELAVTCVALPDANVKGIRSAVKVFEVPWRSGDSEERDVKPPQDTAARPSSTTTFTQH